MLIPFDRSIDDDAAPIVVDCFYGHLFKHAPTSHPDTTEAARALHLAVKKLRAQGNSSFRRWVPFIHLGL